MKRNTMLVACALAAAASLSSAAQDLAVTAGKGAKVILENDKVRVIELTVSPGGKTGMHSHGDNIVYFLTSGDAKLTNADGTTRKRHVEPGEIMWSGPVTHDTVNEGKAETRTLIIELKESSK